MDLNFLEKTLSLPQAVVCISSLYAAGETFITYKAVSRKLEEGAREKGLNPVKIIAREELRDLQSLGWFDRNIMRFGEGLAYERFLSRGE